VLGDSLEPRCDPTTRPASDPADPAARGARPRGLPSPSTRRATSGRPSSS